MSARVHHLANGAVVLCDPAAGFQTLALSVVAGRGSRWEDASRAGWSHLLEHMVFQGAGARSARDIVEAIESEGGQINAYTSHERTSFQVRALEGGLPLAMEIVADLVRRPALNPEDLAKEKQVVLQEIAEAFDTPDDQVFEMTQAAAFAEQPLGRPVLGDAAAIDAADGTRLEAWRANLFAPDRLVISAAGAVDEDELLRLAASLFGDAPATEAASTPSPARFTGGEAQETRALEQAHVVFFLPAAGIADPDVWSLRLFAEMLGGGMSSRLFQEARERLGLAYTVEAWSEAYADAGVIGVYAGCAARNAERLAEACAGQILALAEGAHPEELTRAKAQLTAGLFMGRESLAVRAEQAANQQLALGRVMAPAETAAAIDAVSLDDIAAALGRVLGPGLSAGGALGSKAAMTAPATFAAALRN